MDPILIQLALDVMNDEAHEREGVDQPSELLKLDVDFTVVEISCHFLSAGLFVMS